MLSAIRRARKSLVQLVLSAPLMLFAVLLAACVPAGGPSGSAGPKIDGSSAVVVALLVPGASGQASDVILAKSLENAARLAIADLSGVKIDLRDGSRSRNRFSIIVKHPRTAIDITATATQNLRWVAKAKGEEVRDLTVVILDRPRHADLIAEVRGSGCRVRLITDGDVYGSVATCWPDAGADVLIGIGGTPEGVISAAAMKAMGGEIQARFAPQSDQERTAMIDAGFDLDRVLGQDDMIQSDNCFFAATGLTDGALLRGVRIDSTGIRTQSLQSA